MASIPECSLYILCLLAFLDYHKSSSVDKPSSGGSDSLGNCPKDAKEYQPCKKGKGHCFRPVDGTDKSSGKKRLKCLRKKPCLKLPFDEHGYFSLANITDIAPGATAKLMCCKGYDTTSKVEIFCEVFGNWSIPSEQCRPVDCTGTLPIDPNGLFVQQGNGAFTDLAHLTCEPGYHVVGGASSIVCGEDGVWSETSAYCEPKNCGNPPYVPNGKLDPDKSTLYNATASVSCSVGYKPSDASAQVFCQDDGTWSNTTVTCDPVDCNGTLPLDPNGWFVPKGQSTFNDRADLKCKPGYRVVGDVCSIVCKEDGLWSDALAYCEPKDCGNPPYVPNGKLDPDTSTLYNATASISCSVGHKPSDASAQVICQDDGKWSHTTVTCDPVDCNGALPLDQNGRFVAQGQGTFNDRADLECKPGYQVAGDTRSIFCGQDGLWTDTLAYCKPTDCGSPPYVPNGRLEPNKSTLYTAPAFIRCFVGYKPSDASAQVFCQDDGTWSNTTVTCDPVDCGPNPPLNTTFTYREGSFYTDCALVECGENFQPETESYGIAQCSSDGKWIMLSNLSCIPQGETSFIFGFMANDEYSMPINVFVVSSTTVNVTLSAPLSSFNDTVTVNGSAVLQIPASLRTPSKTRTYPLGFHITSSAPIDVYVEDPEKSTPEGSLIFPENKLSTNYVVVTWWQIVPSLAIVGTADNTSYSIQLPGDDVVTGIINRFELFYLRRRIDLSGGIVSASKNVAVFSGNKCAYVEGFGCDYTYEHVPPIALLKKRYIASFPFPRRKYFIKIVATEDDTHVEISGGITTTLHRSQFALYNITDEVKSINADKSILAATFAMSYYKGSDYNHGPAMLILPGVDGFRTTYNFIVPATTLSAVLMVTIPTEPGAIASLTLNGGSFAGEATRQVDLPGAGNFTILYQHVPAGSNEIHADTPFGATLSLFRNRGESWLSLPYDI